MSNFPEKLKNLKIKRKPPDWVTDVIYVMYMQGLNYSDIYEHLVRCGYDGLSEAAIRNHIYRKRFKEKRDEKRQLDIVECDEYVKNNKLKKLRAVNLAITAITDNIIKDYIEWKSNPAKFLQEVKEKWRPRPMWMTNNVDDLSNLIKIEQFILDEGRQKTDKGGESGHGVQINILSDDARRELLALVSQAKSTAAQKAIEGEVVESEE